ncbi:MAG: hypothetical protein KAW84_05100 [Thermoplasmata archaeon]|nr:hypothetical protein [Thermoplasmata archaeon]
MERYLVPPNHIFVEDLMPDPKRISVEELEERERILAKRERLTLKKMEELAEREADLDVRTKDLKRRERAVANKEPGLKKKEEVLNERKADLEAWEAELRRMGSRVAEERLRLKRTELPEEREEFPSAIKSFFKLLISGKKPPEEKRQES